MIETANGRYMGDMKTLTITEAKKNLGKWLNAAVRGQEIGIVAGDSVISLRKVEIEANDYAWREYGATQEELDKFVKRVNSQVEKLRREGRLIPVPNNLEEALEKIAGISPVRAKTTARTIRRGKRRSRARAA